MKPEIIVLVVIVSVWLLGTIIAYARRDRHAEIRARFWGSRATTGKKVIFAMLWFLWFWWVPIFEAQNKEEE